MLLGLLREGREHLGVPLAIVWPYGSCTRHREISGQQSVVTRLPYDIADGRKGKGRRPLTNLSSINDLMVLERVEVVLDMDRPALLGSLRAKEGVRRTLWRRRTRVALLVLLRSRSRGRRGCRCSRRCRSGPITVSISSTILQSTKPDQSHARARTRNITAAPVPAPCAPACCAPDPLPPNDD